MNEKLARVTAGTTVLSEDLVPYKELQRTRFYADYARYTDICCSVTSVLKRDSGHIAALGVVAEEPHAFTDTDVDWLRALSPHLTRSIEISRKLHAAEVASDDAHRALSILATPILLLAGDGLLVHANAAAEALLRRGDDLHLRQGRIGTSVPSENARLGALISAAASGSGKRGGDMIVHRAPPQRPLTVAIVPLPRRTALPTPPRASVAMFVADPDASCSTPMPSTMLAYGLTLAEARTVAALASGMSLKEAAAHHGISEATARNQLNRALHKTGTNRQAELVRLILASRPPI